jgi:hypothetical protein
MILIDENPKQCPLVLGIHNQRHSFVPLVSLVSEVHPHIHIMGYPLVNCPITMENHHV